MLPETTITIEACHMETILNTLIPVFAIIAIGFSAKHFKWLEDGFWKGAENLAYYLLLPTILFVKISQADFSHIQLVLPSATIVLLANVIIATLIFLWHVIARPEDPDYTAVLQGSIQTNAAYIGLPVALGIFGQEGLVIYAMMLGIVVPVMNTLVLSFLMYYDAQQVKEPAISFLRRVILHPIVVACLGGIAVSYAHITLPASVFNTLSSLSNAALPIGLLVVGSALDINASKRGKFTIATVTLIKLIFLPCIAIMLAKWMGVGAKEAGIAILYTILPASAASYLMAKRYHSNAPLLAGMIVTQTIAAAFTMPIALAVIEQVF